MGGRCATWIEPTADPLVDKRLHARFWSKVDKAGPDGCWIWTAALNRYGYGAFQTGSSEAGTHKTWIAHRYAYIITVGPIPDGLQIDHLCRVRACVNPAHLEAVTSAENNRRSLGYKARRVFCHKGHLKTFIPDGRRICPVCNYESKRRSYLRKRETA